MFENRYLETLNITQDTLNTSIITIQNVKVMISVTM